jgi:hypothetical protein
MNLCSIHNDIYSARRWIKCTGCCFVWTFKNCQISKHSCVRINSPWSSLKKNNCLCTWLCFKFVTVCSRHRRRPNTWLRVVPLSSEDGSHAPPWVLVNVEFVLYAQSRNQTQRRCKFTFCGRCFACLFQIVFYWKLHFVSVLFMTLCYFPVVFCCTSACPNLNSWVKLNKVHINTSVAIFEIQIVNKLIFLMTKPSNRFRMQSVAALFKS